MIIFDLFKKEKCKETKERKEDYLLNQLESINNICKEVASVKDKFNDIGCIKYFSYASLGDISSTTYTHFIISDDKFTYIVDVEFQSMDAQLIGIEVSKTPTNVSINEHEKEHLVFKINYQSEDEVEVYPYINNETLTSKGIRDTLKAIYKYLVETKNLISSNNIIHEKEVERLRFIEHLTY